MLGFLRRDLAELTAYTPHPSGATDQTFDRLDTNESPLDLPRELKEKLNWLYLNEIESNRYPDGSHHHLKEAIATYINEAPQTNITPDQISVGNGSDELIRSLLIATCLQGEGSILVADPTFSMYAIIAQTLGIPVHKIGRDANNFSIDLEAAQQLLQQTQTPPIRVVFVVHPNSPTANPLTKAEIDWLGQISESILVVIDEAYFEFSQNTLVTQLAQHPNWVILRTFSKAFRLASHRLGYSIAHPQLTIALEKVRLPYNLPAFSQAAALMALKHRLEIWPIVEEIIKERSRVFQHLSLNETLQLWPTAANFIYARTKNLPEVKLATALKSEGTLIRHTGGGLRITIGTRGENNRTIERIEKLTKV